MIQNEKRGEKSNNTIIIIYNTVEEKSCTAVSLAPGHTDKLAEMGIILQYCSVPFTALPAYS